MADERTRVLLVGLDRLPAGLVEDALFRHGAFLTIGSVRHAEDVRRAIRDLRPDVIVVGLDEGDLPADCRAFLEERARPQLLAIEGGGRRAIIYELVAQSSELDGRTPDELVQRLAARRSG